MIALTRVLTVLRTQAERVKRGEVSYASIRENSRRIHFRLNEVGRVAPAFRPLVDRRWPSVRATEGDVIFFDQQIYDLHWWACRGHTGVSADGRAVFNGGFNASAANYFVRLRHRMEAKVAHVGLLPTEQIESIWLVSGELRRLRERELSKAEAQKNRLHNRLRDRSVPTTERESLKRIDIDRVVTVWLAHKLAKAVYHNPPSAQQIADMAVLVSGDPSFTRDAIRHQLVQVRKHLA